MAITLNELEQHLWAAANILRGSIDSGEYKSYIFGLLFFKRLSDVWDEEYEQKLKEYGDTELAADADEHRFDLPKGNHWSDVRKHTTNIGEHLNAAFQAIEDANMKLRGIFQSVDFNNKERFSDAIVERLLQHFEKYDLRNSNVEADVLGNAYEYLIKQFADDGGKKGGEFYTPKEVVRLMIECLGIDEGMSVYDPTCGSGGMLLEAYRSVERNGKNPRSLSLFGQERNLNTWAICQMNLFLHDIDDADIRKGDTLREPRHLLSEGSKALASFDRVIGNPPFSLEEWGYTSWKNGDVYGRDTYGCPPARYGDFAFVQHMVSTLNANGKLAVVVPHGVLFRGDSEGAIRRNLIDDDLIEGVIGLAPNLFYGTPIAAAILILNKNKPGQLKDHVVFVNGASCFSKGTPKNFISPTDAMLLVRSYFKPAEADEISSITPTREIVDNDYTLNVSRYVSLSEKAEQIDVGTETGQLIALMKDRDTAEQKILKQLRELGYVQ